MTDIDLHHCPTSDLLWTDDQIRADTAPGEARSGLEPVSVEPVFHVPWDDLTGISGHANPEDLASVVELVAGRPPGLLVALADEHASRRYSWSAVVFDTRVARATRDPGQAILFSFEASGLDRLATELDSYYAGYRSSLRRTLRTELRHADESDYDDLFREVIDLDPRWALALLRDGVPGHTPDAPRTAIAGTLSPAVLEPLLESRDRAVREEAIQLLSDLKRSTGRGR